MEAQKEELDAKISELRAWPTGGPTERAAAAEPVTPKRRRMSAAARKRIGDAQRKRWAASKKAAEPSVPEVAPKSKRKLSAAGRKAIIAATKKRWEAVRAAKAQQEKVTTKKPAKTTAKKAPVKKAPVKKVGREENDSGYCTERDGNRRSVSESAGRSRQRPNSLNHRTPLPSASAGRRLMGAHLAQAGNVDAPSVHRKMLLHHC